MATIVDIALSALSITLIAEPIVDIPPDNDNSSGGGSASPSSRKGPNSTATYSSWGLPVIVNPNEPSRDIAQHYRVFGIDGLPLNCNSSIVIYTNVTATPCVSPCSTNCVSLRFPIGTLISYVNLAYAPSLVDDLRASGDDFSKLGIDISGSAGAGISISGTTISVGVSANAKVKVNGTTVLSVSEDLSITKDLSELTPCANVEITKGKLRVTGTVCIEGAQICFRNGELLVDYRNWKRVCSIPPVCVGFMLSGHGTINKTSSASGVDGERDCKC